MTIISFCLVSALILGGLFLARTVARSGFHVVDEQGQLVIFEGRRGGFLTFEPSRLSDSAVDGVLPLTEAQSAAIEDGVSTRAEAQALIDAIVSAQADPANAEDGASSSSSEPSEPATEETEGEQGSIPSADETEGSLGTLSSDQG